MTYKNTEEFSLQLDENDELKHYRNEFSIPLQKNGEEHVYLCGNSLGLQAKRTKSFINQELEDWATFGVEGHFHAKNPWMPYHEFLTESYSKIVGSKQSEVVAMNTLTVNLHLMMVSFYRPTKDRYKIIIETDSFPSDIYAVESQIKHHGYSVNDSLIKLTPRDGESSIRTEDIAEIIDREGNEIALIMLGGVNYYTGQVFDFETITKLGQDKGIVVGFDLAHAAGNVKLDLHKWGVDFAVWCSYKYLNSGPGSVAGAFVHERHANNPELIRLAGWWGYDKETRFEMKPGFKPMRGAEGWQLSNAPVFSMAIHMASLAQFDEVGMPALRKKSDLLTAYMEYVIDELSANLKSGGFELITPRDPEQRGAQLSILAHGQGKTMFDRLTKLGVIADWREPNVIRVAPVPMYNSFEDVFRFGEALKASLSE